MRDDRPSFTAAWVAACRGAADLLPADARLVHDPFGLALAGPAFERSAALARRLPGLTRRALPRSGALMQSMLWLQLRTFAIDAIVREFAAHGGAQLVLLGAGLDARAWRLAGELGRAHVYEVDHPATQVKKRGAVQRARVGTASAAHSFVEWDFERRALHELPGELASRGLDQAAATLTIWEGVTMYLSEAAIASSLAAVRSYSGPGSELALTYFEGERLQRSDAWTRLVKLVVARAGEPFTFGWRAGELGPYLASRGFSLARDESDIDLVRRLLPPGYERYFRNRGGHVALAKREA